MAGLNPKALHVGFLLLVLLSADFATGCVITIRNRCSYSVTACAQSGSGPVSRYNVGAGGSQAMNFGSSCSWPDGIIFPSVGGQCTDRNLANIAEFTLGGFANSDYYDLSNINAYTIGLEIRPTQIAGGATPGGMRCGSPKCVINDIRGFCQPNNYIVQHPTGALTCVNRDGTAGVQGSAGTRQFKNACPSSYSYPDDGATSLYNCPTGTNYDVVFCP
ncbi:hypothetical protein MPTK1_2g01690 [Marchantia polymorpha subsp. ruderalis]|uniref:Thaumatin-like protein n=2 Tax=Marchantia polymorpha TaxID=3197 RepID=A0A176WFW7_MARPO|nr:hypothetical protein AXG93_4202s1120 [Marchantia polymorpha subsp. ruderalis]PTQ27901.1 hypothetical protein MARPO_0180s0023 [Marchantia polymorpha]BBN00740.1 hypothetical protein Mp_2g01690 [Marchantia polymorpha subsp. ruderalis]|eukprot:PTQ27901.1 hypothetical protein MARPO_0180s0023 [Marchantia polymorpha]